MIKKILTVITILVFVCSVSFADSNRAVEDYFNPERVFTDLQGYEWAEEAIYTLAEYGLIEDEGGRVYPQRYINRAEFTKLVVGAFGLYDFDAECDFTDVDKSSEYCPYIATAYKLGIIKGVKADKFGIDEFLSRQDMATIIYRTVQNYGTPLTEFPVLDFADAKEIDGYATEAVSALLGAKAVSGNLSYEFLPKNNANFAEACKILYYIMLKNT